MKKLVSTLGMDEKTWLTYRKRGIGGSDAGAVCGLNPYRSAMEVYLDKTTAEIEQIDNEAMRQGREFEDYVARRFMEATGKKVRRANAMFYNEQGMAKKTVIKQALKYAPIKADFRRALSTDETIKNEIAENMDEVTAEDIFDADYTEESA